MIEINNEQDIFEIDENMKKNIETAVSATLEHEGFIAVYEVDVIITENDSIQEINRTYRNIDRATDVLSFPMLSYKNGTKLDQNCEDDTNPETGAVILGDIVLSIEKAKEQALEYGHSFEREIAFLIVHSTLHLMGYDHEEDSDREIMRTKEEAILMKLNLQR